LLLLLQPIFKVPSISTHAGSQTSTPLIHCRTDDVVIQVAPLLYQSLHQVVGVQCSRQYTCVNWQCWRRQFSAIFFIKSNISSMDRLSCR